MAVESSLHVRVLLFGPEATALGRDSVEATLAPGGTVADLRAALALLHPALRAGHVRVAVNHAFAPPEQRIEAGDEVAVIGLVSGG